MYKDLITLCDKPQKHKHYNLTEAENQSLKHLMENTQITIRQADKGGSVVVQNKVDYIKEADWLLADTETYLKLRTNPLPVYQQELESLVYEAWENGVLTKKKRQFMLPPEYSTPHFYHLPKVHKSLIDPLGRPIVASTNSFTNGLSIYIDSCLQTLVNRLPAYIKNSSEVINVLQQYTWEEGYMWASLDVASLYTSIPHDIGLRAV